MTKLDPAYLSELHEEDVPPAETKGADRAERGSRHLVLLASPQPDGIAVGRCHWRRCRVADRGSAARGSRVPSEAASGRQPDGRAGGGGAAAGKRSVAAAQRKRFAPQREIIGRLVEVHKVTVASEVTGKIIAMPVEEGTQVVANETVLAKIDDVWSRLAKQRIQAQMESAGRDAAIRTGRIGAFREADRRGRDHSERV